jgi:hypothetical protein
MRNREFAITLNEIELLALLPWRDLSPLVLAPIISFTFSVTVATVLAD